MIEEQKTIRELHREIDLLRAELDRALDFLLDRGYHKCDSRACNCERWHGGTAETQIKDIIGILRQTDFWQGNAKDTLEYILNGEHCSVTRKDDQVGVAVKWLGSWGFKPLLKDNHIAVMGEAEAPGGLAPHDGGLPIEKVVQDSLQAQGYWRGSVLASVMHLVHLLEASKSMETLEGRLPLKRFLEDQKTWSSVVFGPGKRHVGIGKHIAKELIEAENDPHEWIDVILLAFDGANRAGLSSEQIVGGLVQKQHVNKERRWPAWQPQDQPAEHVRLVDVDFADLELRILASMGADNDFPPKKFEKPGHWEIPLSHVGMGPSPAYREFDLDNRDEELHAQLHPQIDMDAEMRKMICEKIARQTNAMYAELFGLPETREPEGASFTMEVLDAAIANIRGTKKKQSARKIARHAAAYGAGKRCIAEMVKRAETQIAAEHEEHPEYPFEQRACEPHVETAEGTIGVKEDDLYGEGRDA